MTSTIQSVPTRDTCSEENSNFLKIFLGILKVIVPLLRQILSEKITYSYLADFLKRNKKGSLSNLLKERHMSLDTYPFPEYDFSLLYAIFRDIKMQDLAHPTQGWGKRPEQCEVSFGDDLERIRLLKNHISHSITAIMNKREFEYYWDMLYSVTQRNDQLLKVSEEFTDKLQKLGTESLCYDTYKELEQTLKEWREEEMGFKDFIEDHCFFHLREAITASEMTKIRENAAHFAHTSATARALHMLQRENFLVIVGLTGDGKTWLGKYLMTQITDRTCLLLNFCNINTLSLPSDKKYVIFFDDCFYDVHAINEHSSLLHSLFPKIKDGTFKIIIACTPSRFQLCRRNKFLSQYLESDCVIHISGNGKHLPLDDKIVILQSASQKLMGKDMEKMPLPFGFPKCIKIMMKENHEPCEKRFKEIVVKYFFDIINNMYDFHGSCFLVLLKVFQDKSIARQITSLWSLQQGSRALDIDKAIEELESDGILRMENTKFFFTYPSLFEEVLAKLLALKYPEMFIRSCPLQFLAWVNIGNDQDAQHNWNGPQFCDDHIQILFQRIKKELKTKDRSVFETISSLPVLEQIPCTQIQSLKDMTDEDNTTLLNHVTRASRFSTLAAMLNGLPYGDTYNILKDILLETSMDGNKRMVEFILSQKRELLNNKTDRLEIVYTRETVTGQPSQKQEDDASYLASICDKHKNNILMIAVKSGKRDLVEYIYSINPTLLNQRNIHEETILHAAATSNNFDVFEYVRKLLPENELLTRNNEGNSALHFAAKLGNLAIIKYLAHTFPDDFVQLYNDNGMAPLHICVIHGNIDVLMHLQIDITKKAKSGETILHLVARNRNRKEEPEKVIHLIVNPDIIHQKDGNLKTALHAAAESGSIEVFRYLLDVGFSIDSITNTGDWVFHLAASNANSGVLKYLLHSCSKYPDIQHIRNNSGFTPLHSSAASNVIDIFTNLIDAGYSVDSLTNFQQTVLHLASQNGCLNIVNHILENFQYLTQLEDWCGLNALHYAATGGHIPIFKLLLQYGIPLTGTTNAGKTVFHLAVENNHQNLVDFILQTCDENETRFIQSRDEEGMTVLNIAAKKGLVDMFKILKVNVFARKNLNHFTIGNKTILLMAIAPGNVSMVKYLLTCDGIKDIVKQTTDDKSTALHLAAVSGDVEVYEALEKEFSIKVVNSSGSTVLHLAATNGHLKLIQHILKQKYSTGLFKIRDKMYRSPLLLALGSGHKDVAVELIERRGPLCLSDRDDQGLGCIHYAALSGKSEMINFLLEKDPDSINRRTMNGYTALFYAIKADSMDVYNVVENRCTGKHFIATKSCNTILHYAANIGNVRFVNHILKAHKELRHTRNSLGKSCMHVASESGHVDIVKLLVDRGHVTDNLTDCGDNILDLAIYSKKHKMQFYIRKCFPKIKARRK